MCVYGEDVCWTLCGGKYKFLLRSAWIILVITTSIDICAIMAYWQLAPKTLDSEPGLRLALILLVAVNFLQFFSALLSGFVIMEVSPRMRELIGDSTSLDGDRSRYGLTTGFELNPMPYSDGFRQVLPNNAPLLPYINSSIADSTELQNSGFNIRESARSNIGYRNPNLNDSYSNRYNTQSCDELTEVLVVPKIVITPPESSAPIYENTKALTCETSTKSQNNLDSTTSANVAIQNETPNLPLNIEAQTCELSARSRSSLCSCSNVGLQNNPKDLPQSNFYRSCVIRPSSAIQRPYLKACVSKPNIYSRHINLKNKCLFSRSESYVDRPDANEDEKSVETSINQEKIASRKVDSNPTIRSDVSSGSDTTSSEKSDLYKNLSSTRTRNTVYSSAKSKPVVYQYRQRGDSNSAFRSNVASGSDTTGSEKSGQYKNISSTVTCNTDSAKSQLVVNQHRRYVVDKLPTESNPQAEMIFKTVLKSEKLFKQANYVPEANDVVNTIIPILV